MSGIEYVVELMENSLSFQPLDGDRHVNAKPRLCTNVLSRQRIGDSTVILDGLRGSSSFTEEEKDRSGSGPAYCIAQSDGPLTGKEFFAWVVEWN